MSAWPVGHSRTVDLAVTPDVVDAFADFSGDRNRLHMDAEYATDHGFPRRVAHGAISVALISRLIGMELPGEGALWRTLEVRWLQPVYAGDQLAVTGTVSQSSEAANSLVLDLTGHNQHGARVLTGRADVGLGGSAPADAAPVRVTGDDAGEARPAPTDEPPAAEPASCPVLVTGGSRGIGRTICLELGRLGYPVLVGYRQAAEQAAEVAGAIRDGGGRAATAGFDLTDPDAAASVVAGPATEVGAPRALVHAASPPLHRVPVHQVTAGQLDQYWSVYVRSGMSLVQAMWPEMQRRRHGRVVFLGTSAIIGAPPAGLAPYVTAKAALLGMARAMAVELGAAGVTVNVVSPSLTITDLTGDVSPRVQLREAQLNPMRRLASTDDTARMVAFLLSPAASFVNGAHVPVTGGSAVT